MAAAEVAQRWNNDNNGPPINMPKGMRKEFLSFIKVPHPCILESLTFGLLQSVMSWGK